MAKKENRTLAYGQAWANETLLSVSFLREGFYRLLVNIFIISFLIRYLRICSSKSPKIFKSIGSNLRNFLASLFAVASPLPSPGYNGLTGNTGSIKIYLQVKFTQPKDNSSRDYSLRRNVFTEFSLNDFSLTKYSLDQYSASLL